MGYIFDALNQYWKGDGDNDHNAANRFVPPPASADSDQTPDDCDADPRPTARSDTPATPGGLPGPDQNDDPAPEPLKFGEHAKTIDVDKLSIDDRMVAITEPSSVMAEEYRSLRTGILAKWDQKRHLVHTITSATPREGKTITTLNLGVAFSELRNRRTAVLEADLRLPQFEKMMSLPPQPGLVGLLEGQTDLSGAVHRLMNDRLHVITAGRKIDNMRAVQMLSGSAMAALVQTLRQSYDHVIIDTPPVIELADAGILGTISDEVLLIARMNRTPRPLVDQAIRTLTSYNVFIGGLVATDQPRDRRQYYKYGYKYGYSYDDNPAYTSQKAA